MPSCRDDADLMYRLLVRGVTDYAIYMLTPDGTIANWNAGAQRTKGYTAEEIVGLNFACFYSPEDRAAGLPEHGLRTARQEGRFEAEGWRRRKDDSRFWAHVVIDAIHDDEGRFIGFAKITRDCTERQVNALKLDSALGNLDLAMSNMAQGLCLIDDDGRVVLANERMHEILAVPSGEPLVGASIGGVLAETLSEAASLRFLQDHLRRDLDLNRPEISEIVHGEQVLSVTTRRPASGGWVSTFVDVTERRRFETQIQHLAQHDPLTDLANRAALRQALTETLASARWEDCAVLYIDLDRFKPINDTFGHAVGDQILQEAARRLRLTVRPQDVIARLGGDEFALVLSPADPQRVAEMARTILDALNQPYGVKRLPIRIGASIGIAVAPLAGRDPDILLRNADLALYEAKKEGRNRYSFYDPAMGDKAAARSMLEADLNRALERREFVLHYQPIVRARTGATIGFEALLRWRRPDGVATSPADFVPAAEEAGLMPEIGAWILAEACREAMAWPAHLTVAVNVSATQLRSAQFIDAVERALAESGLPPHRLEIEITETAVLQNRELALSLLRRLRVLGVMIALDDFGTGYSSLSFVHTFPLTRLKIDRSFVRGLGHDPQSAAIVRAIIGLSRSLGLAVTAEGVETEDQRRLLAKERGLDMQGYLFGHPEPAAHLDPHLTRHRSARRLALPKEGRGKVQKHPEAA
ncbi:MAG TPA: EAL domain-containing protein [Methylobacterium sp.]|jgi:diguanylate cyclase (GGDEF)-like protein/PAS domain S-box-containing protein|uniref:sensor domain-containing protein n=1 Tax=Methylorubrum sp. B1-46 TaxID=2897334 RepID=UPI001E6011D6|nr:EAL domain-containing protein [Methylorubrum sp. B1-46]UGB28019.1 EAL domain-containing protein [Methylorubrum sp. B1-46]HEV2541472.1 EAL domain-containing protein [Methylobacterium sp.]